MVLFGLLIAYLAKSEPYSMFFLLICGYLVSQCLVSLATFAVNRTYMSQKDRRLGANIADSCDSKVMEERAKELKANRRFLLMKMVSKFGSPHFDQHLHLPHRRSQQLPGQPVHYPRPGQPYPQSHC